MSVMVSSYGLQVPFGNTNTFIRSVVGCLSVLMFLKLTQKCCHYRKKHLLDGSLLDKKNWRSACCVLELLKDPDNENE